MNIKYPPSESNIKEWQYHGLIKLLLDSLPSKNQKKKHLRVIEKSKSYESAYTRCMELIEEYNDYKTKARKENRRVEMYVQPADIELITKYLPREVIVEPYTPKHFDIESIKRYCWSSKEVFEKIYRSYPDMVCDTVVTGNGLKYIYWSRPGSTLLFVAHLDFVCDGQTYSQKGNKFYLQNLDDRLGAYLICAGLPHLLDREVKFDVLFTDGEETGRSTAKFFTKEKCKNQYNWMAEFDRRGDDVVMYSYETPEMRKLLTDNGFKVGIGSYTDIASLEDLGVKGFNFGIGYQANHSADAYFEGDVLDKQMELMADFINKYHTTKFIHEKKAYSYTTRTYTYGDAWSNDGAGKNTTYTTTKTDKGIVPGKIYVLNGNTFVEKIKCKMCDKLDCTGIVTCSACKIDFHNSLILKKFGMCSFCLIDLYGINVTVLDLIREWSFSTNKQITDKEGLTYDEKDILGYIAEINGIINDTNKSS